MITTRSPASTNASIKAEATARTHRWISLQVQSCQAPSPSRWWTRPRPRYFATWRRMTPIVVRSEIFSGSRAEVAAVSPTDVALLDQFDGEGQRPGWDRDRYLVAFLASHERTPDW